MGEALFVPTQIKIAFFRDILYNVGEIQKKRSKFMKCNLFFRAAALALSLVMVFAMAACQSAPAEPTTEPATEPTTAPTVPAPTVPQVEVKNPVTYFSMSMGENYEFIRSLTAYPNEDGTVRVEYVGDVKKVGDLDGAVLHAIVAEMEKAGLEALNGRNVYLEGEANGSMYISFANGSYYGAGFSGTIPEEYRTAYEAMETYFESLTAHLDEYVPQPLVDGNVDADILAAMMDILNASGIEPLDSLMIMEAPAGESFSYVLGLGSSEGITAGASCSALMSTTAYSLAIVTVDDAGKLSDVCGDFESNLAWRRWVCVAPQSAMIATKGNMVLCVMGSGDMFSGTVSGAEGAGWTTVKTLKNPDLQ